MKHILRRTLAVSISFAVGMMVVPAVYGDDISFNEDTMKDETVYISTDADGTTKSITVNDELKNLHGLNSIADISDLSNIVNVKGDESFKQDGNHLTWNSDDENIVYQGTSNKELPVGYHVRYFLDGKEIKESDLAEKSGHVQVEFDFENKTKDKFIPFLMLAGMYIKADKIIGLTINHGKTLSDGDKQAVIAYGLPGIKQALKLQEDDISLPESATVQFDVENYKESQIAVIATNEVFAKELPASMDNLTGLHDKLNSLRDATSQLADGGHQLKDGLDQLNDKTPELASGITQLVDGSQQLADGQTQLQDGLVKISDGTHALLNGAQQLQDGMNIAYTSTASQLEPGSRQLSDGLNQMNTQLASNLPMMLRSVQQLNQGVAQTTNAIDQLANGLSANHDHIQEMNQGIQTIATTMQAMDTQAQTLKQLSTGLRQIASTMSTGTISAIGDATGTATVSGTIDVTAMNQMEINELQNVLGTLNSSSAEYASIQNVITSLQGKTSESVSLTDTVTMHHANVTIAQTATSSAQLAELVNNLDALADGMSQEASALNTALNNNGAQSIAPAFNAFSLQMDITVQSLTALNTQINPALTDGMNQLSQGLNDFAQQSGNGLNRLSAGAMQLHAGIEQQLLPGLSQLSDGSVQLNSGLNILGNNTVQVVNGSTHLADGTMTLYGGLSALQQKIPTLTDGIAKLNNGSVSLSNGLDAYQQEAIEPLISKLEDDLIPIIEKAKDLMKDAQSYNNFSGIHPDMKGTVKFVFIKNSDN